jgi:hypothetical protein
MNEFLNRNIDALADVAVLYAAVTGMAHNTKMVEMAALIAKSAALDWYRKNGIEFDITIEDLCPEALQYATVKLFKIGR